MITTSFTCLSNGMYHYKPIHGKLKLKNCKAKDKRKVCLAKKLGINLIVISDMGSYNPKFVRQMIKEK